MPAIMATGSSHDDEQKPKQKQQQRRHHVVLFPFMAQGHFIPFVALANLIDQRHHQHHSTTVTLVTTPLNASNLRSLLPSDSRVQVHHLPFHATDHGLPPGAENTDSIPHPLVVRLCQATLSLEPHFDCLLSDIAARDRCPTTVSVVADIFLGWTVGVARRHGASHTAFTTCGAHGTAVYASLWLHLPHVGKGEEEEFGVPGFPDSFRLRRTQLSGPLRSVEISDVWTNFFQKQTVLALSSDGLLCNSVEELEPEGTRLLRKTANLPVWPVGPLFVDDKSTSVRRAGKKTGVSVDACMEWLDSHRPSSVLYVSFGSQNTISAAQMMALAAGLEASGKAFLWVIRPPIGFDLEEEFRDEWLPTGFEKRMSSSGQGLLVRNWAPQLEIVSHRAVGGFLSHCGWNSTLESLARGVPMIGWPMAAEQFYNSKMLEEELGVCVEMARGVVDGVVKEEVERIVRSVVGGEMGVEMRQKAAEAAKKINGALAEEEGRKGSSLTALDQFFDSMKTRY